MVRRIAVFTLSALSLLTAAMPAVAGSSKSSKPGNIVQVAREAGSFTTLLKAVEAAGLTGTLSGQGKGPFTVFAPTDAAFAKLPAGTVEALLRDPAALKNILLYHVVDGEYRAANVVSRTSLKMLNGQTVTIGTTGGARINDAAIVATDVAARNGVIHVIDTVLLPR